MQRFSGGDARANATDQQALELKPNSPYIYLLLGNAYRKKEEIESAIDSYDKGLALNPGNPVGLSLNLGETLIYQKQFDPGIMLYKKALLFQQDDPNPIIYFRFGNAALQQNNFEKAIDCYNLSLKLNPQKTFGIYRNLADAFKQNKQMTEAIDADQKALELQANHQNIRPIINKLDA